MNQRRSDLTVPIPRLPSGIPTVPIPRLPSGIPTVPIWRMTVANYHQLLDRGIVTAGEPLELLQGWLVPKMQKSPLHVFVASQLEHLLRELLPDSWWIDRQNPITMADSEPEPDIAIVRGDVHEYTDHHPTPGDTALIIEVAHSTLEIDRGLKLQIYASAGIAEYWIANIPDSRIEVYTGPIGRPVVSGVPHEIETKEGYPLSVETNPAARYLDRRDYSLCEFVPLSIEDSALGHIAVSDVFAHSETTPSP